MGYFRPRISRQRCAAHVAAAVARQARADLMVWRPAPDAPPAGRGHTVFLRFAVGEIHADSQQPLGVFQAAYGLRRRYGSSSGTGRRFDPALQWFGENLVAPEDVPTRAIFWFKSDAGACVGRIWEMIHALKVSGLMVWMMRCHQPGNVVYEDAHQVAAVPHRTRSWRTRPV